MTTELNFRLQSTTLEFTQNYILIWLDYGIDASNQYYINVISQLQNVIYSVFTFTDADQCVDFLTDIDNEKVFMILSNSLVQQLITLIQDQAQIDSIYIFPEKEHEPVPTKQWMNELYNQLKRDTHRCDYNNGFNQYHGYA